jgi:hypothetical protein
VQRRQVGQRGDLGTDFLRDPHGGRELAAVDHSMSSTCQGRPCGQGGRRNVLQVVQKAPNRFGKQNPHVGPYCPA